MSLIIRYVQNPVNRPSVLGKAGQAFNPLADRINQQSQQSPQQAARDAAGLDIERPGAPSLTPTPTQQPPQQPPQQQRPAPSGGGPLASIYGFVDNAVRTLSTPEGRVAALAAMAASRRAGGDVVGANVIRGVAQPDLQEIHNKRVEDFNRRAEEEAARVEQQRRQLDTIASRGTLETVDGQQTIMFRSDADLQAYQRQQAVVNRGVDQYNARYGPGGEGQRPGWEYQRLQEQGRQVNDPLGVGGARAIAAGIGFDIATRNIQVTTGGLAKGGAVVTDAARGVINPLLSGAYRETQRNTVPGVAFAGGLGKSVVTGIEELPMLLGGAPAAAVGAARSGAQIAATNPRALPGAAAFGAGGVVHGTASAAVQDPAKFAVQWVAIDAATGGVGGVGAGVRGVASGAARGALRSYPVSVPTRIAGRTAGAVVKIAESPVMRASPGELIMGKISELRGRDAGLLFKDIDRQGHVTVRPASELRGVNNRLIAYQDISNIAKSDDVLQRGSPQVPIKGKYPSIVDEYKIRRPVDVEAVRNFVPEDQIPRYRDDANTMPKTSAADDQFIERVGGADEPLIARDLGITIGRSGAKMSQEQFAQTMAKYTREKYLSGISVEDVIVPAARQVRQTASELGAAGEKGRTGPKAGGFAGLGIDIGLISGIRPSPPIRSKIRSPAITDDSIDAALERMISGTGHDGDLGDTMGRLITSTGQGFREVSASIDTTKPRQRPRSPTGQRPVDDEDTQIVPLITGRSPTKEEQSTRTMPAQMQALRKMTDLINRNPLEETRRGMKPKPMLLEEEKKPKKRKPDDIEDALIHDNPFATPAEMLDMLGL